MKHTRFTRYLSFIAFGAAVLRVVYVVGWKRDAAFYGDPYVYHYGANLLVKGHGFIAPLQYIAHGISIEGADHPPLYTLWLAIPSLFGLGTHLGHMLWSCVLSVATVVVGGLLGRRVGGDRDGLIAAGLIAVYPGIWFYDGLMLSETLAIFTTTLVVLCTFRMIDEPSMARARMLGVACALVALSRSELLVLLPFLAWPACLLARNGEWKTRLARVGVVTLITVAILSPWVAYNLGRFHHPVFLSSQLETTLAGANCADTYNGDFTGLLTATCVVTETNPYADQSDNDAYLRPKVRHFIRENIGHVPTVMAIRVGRVLGLYRPYQQADFDTLASGVDHPLAMAILYSNYVVDVLAIAGIVVMVRRKRELFPLLVPIGAMLATVAFTYGFGRFRASAETSLVVLAAVAIGALFGSKDRQGEETTSTVNQSAPAGEPS